MVIQKFLMQWELIITLPTVASILGHLLLMEIQGIVLKLTLSLYPSELLSKASLIILPPISASKIKAIQWSTLVTKLSKVVPKKYPITGIKAWNTPK